MTDLVRAGVLLVLLAGVVRARFALGIVLATAVTTIFAVEVVRPLLTPIQQLPLAFGIGSVILGPSILPSSGTLGDVLADPTHHLVSAVLLSLGAWRAFHHSRPLPPHTPEAHRYDRAGLRFVGAAVLYALLAISGLLVHALFREP